MKAKRIARLLLHGLFQAGPVLIVATFLVFAMMQLVPGDVAIALAGENATRERVEEIRVLYGLDRPLWEQYTSWLWKMMQGDMSVSMLSGEPVLESILRRLPVTLLVVSLAMLLSLVVGIPLGITASVRPRSAVDSFVTVFASLGIALPSFWLAMILVSIFAMGFGWFPVSGMVRPAVNPWGAVWHAILPAIALAASGVAEVARQTRSALLEVQSSQYMRTLLAKGLPRRLIFWKHGLKNISVTLLTVIGLLFNRLLGGTVVIEAVFAISGMGSLVVSAATGKDYPVIQGVMLTMVLIVITVNLIIEILYAVFDPRVLKK
ncbi:ABC transporter permease [Ferrovibrio sp. MS7]|uniref:ABC transporter permease n=1 Tax=Ferrovibrio TaxID=1231242 RepID=UPI003135797C